MTIPSKNKLSKTHANDKNLGNISPEECLKLYLKVFDSSNQNWQAAIHLGNAGFYGQGITVATAAIEESIKAFILQLDGLGFGFRSVRGVSRFFKEHVIRHISAGLLMLAYLLASDLDKTLKELFTKPEKLIQLSLRIPLLSEQYIIGKIETYINHKAAEMQSELSFFQLIETCRQQGFYADYNGSFYSSQMITQADYHHSMQRFEVIKKFITEFSIAFAQPEQSEVIKGMIELLRKNHYHDKLADYLNGIRSQELFDRFDNFLNKAKSFTFEGL